MKGKGKRMENTERFIDVKVVSQHLGVAKSFIYKLIADRRIPYYKIGCRYLFKLSEVEQVLVKEMKYA